MMKMNSAPAGGVQSVNYYCRGVKNDMTVTVGQGRNVAAVANHVGVS
ncbi:hypothetical protein [Klebsiella pneumoniae]|nr:hypothetical protein [Klebsiella pneumoniae]